MNLHKSDQKAFTLIELLVVISIIGLLSSAVLASLNTARSKARDTRRLSDLVQIRTAMELYFSKCSTYIVAVNCTGATYGSGGIEWFGHPYTATGSVAQGLVDNGVLPSVILDPSNITTSNSVDRSGYMIAASATNYTIWANLENPTGSQIATQNNCSLSGYDNYQASYPAIARINYCVSN